MTAIVLLSAATATPVIVGTTLSFSVAVLLLWEVDASLPAASYIPLSVGTTVNVSDPLGVPDNGIPSVYTLPLIEMLDGVALDSVATPPLMLSAKSATSNAPLPPLVL